MVAALSEPTATADALNHLVDPGQVFEIRALNAALRGDNRTGTIYGYFDSPEKAADAVKNITRADGVYFTANPVTPALLARSANRLKVAYTKQACTTSDHDVVSRRWFLIDVDPKRPAGVSSNDAEHEASIATASEIRSYLRELGWPDPIHTDSGNGCHLMYRVDLDADDDGLLAECLAALASMFNDDVVKLDTSICNPARIWKLPGTRACKGDDIPDRPHRMSRILTAPDDMQVVPSNLLEELAAKAPKPETAKPAKSTNGKATHSDFQIDKWITDKGVPVGAEEKWGTGRKWVFGVCPFNSDHNRGEAVITEQAGGVLAFTCHHESCKGQRWEQLRELFDPKSKRPTKAPPRKQDNGGAEEQATDVNVVWVRADQVTPKRINWLWPHRIAAGKLNTAGGDPGLGKTLAAQDIASRVSRGEPWPDLPDEPTEAGDVIYISAEDDAEDTLVPRFMANGADLSRIHILQAVEFWSGKAKHQRGFTLADLPGLEAKVKEVRPRLIVIDPIAAFTGKINAKSVNEVQGVLGPLQRLAAEYGVAVLTIEHINKTTTQTKAIYRFQDSIALVGKMRTAWLVTVDPDDVDRRLMTSVKGNVSKKMQGLAFTVGVRDLAELGTQPYAQWDSTPVDMTANEVLEREAAVNQKQGDPDKVEKAKSMLLEILAHGPKFQTKVHEEITAAGIGERTIRTARAKVGVLAKRIDDHWILRLPDELLARSTQAQDAEVVAHVRREHEYNPDDH